MAALLNETNALYKEKLEADRRVAEERDVQKREHMQHLINEFAIWLEEFYNVPQSKWDEVTADTVIDLMDAIVDYIGAINDLKTTLKVVNPVPKKTGVTKVIKSNTPDETIDAFLKQMGW